MSAERLLESTWKATLRAVTAITTITGGVNGVVIEHDYSQAVTYPTLLIRVEPSADISGFEAISINEYKEARVYLTCETYKADDLSGSVVNSLYDALYTTVTATTILSTLDTKAAGGLTFYESKIMPNEGYFLDTEEVRERTIVIRNKVRVIPS